MPTPAERIAITYFEAFKTKNAELMASLYKPGSENIFYDPVFTHLNSDEVSSMWKMLLKGAGDLEVSYKMISVDESTAEVEWVATYTYSPTKRKVQNIVRTKMKIENEKIVSQNDSFDLCKWTTQALPPVAAQIFCWFPDLTIRKIAGSQLHKFMKK